LIESALIEQNVDEYASIFFTFSQIKQFATQKQFRKFNRQYLKNQQTVLSSPDSPCQTVLKFPQIHARQFWIFSAFYSPLLLHAWKPPTDNLLYSTDPNVGVNILTYNSHTVIFELILHASHAAMMFTEEGQGVTFFGHYFGRNSTTDVFSTQVLDKSEGGTTGLAGPKSS